MKLEDWIEPYGIDANNEAHQLQLDWIRRVKELL